MNFFKDYSKKIKNLVTIKNIFLRDYLMATLIKNCLLYMIII